MTALPSPLTVRVEPEDVTIGFRCGKQTLDDYFARHAVTNTARGVGITYVLRRYDDAPGVPPILGYYTISMAVIESALASKVMATKLPKYPLPAGLIGKLASDERTRGRGMRVGETLLLDAIVRILSAADLIGCVGIVLDALDESAEAFYQKYGFITVVDTTWPRRMFLHTVTARALFST
jgi:hypothetical protein